MTKKKRKIGIFTGNRAEYSLIQPIINSISKHPSLDYQLYVSGSHLDINFGYTCKEIINDGFNIYAKIKVKSSKGSILSNSEVIGSIIKSVSKYLNKNKPDIFVVYADRFEAFAALIAATQMNIPTIHIEGGDKTQGGCLDDSVRHSMTKLAHFHFTTNLEATKRILSLGEEPWRIFTVGLPSNDLIKDKKFATKDEVLKKFKLDLLRPILIFTQHSITTQIGKVKMQITESIKALRALANLDYQIIITYPNNDAGSNIIVKEINKLKKKKINSIQVYKSLGRHMYFGLLALSYDENSKIICIGNSSSGIKETPAFKCPSINIGNRQDKRLAVKNVINVDYDSKEIIDATKKIFFDRKIKQKLKKLKNPYYFGRVGKKVASIIYNIKLNDKVLNKKITY